MAARKPTSTSAQAGDRKVSVIGAVVALVLAAVGGTAFFIQPNPQRPSTAATTEPSVPLPTASVSVTPPPTDSHPVQPPTAPTPEKIDKSTKPKPPPRDPG